MKQRGYPQRNSHPTLRDNPTRHCSRALVTSRTAEGAKQSLHHLLFQVPDLRRQAEAEEFGRQNGPCRHFGGMLAEGPEEDIEVRTLVLFRSTRILG